MVVITGGPQYRVGSHRQSVLLGRYLAGHGYAVLRFDVRGMGDSEGEFSGFEHLNEDINAAIDCLFDHVQGLERVVLWGLCDGASAATFYASRDPRVSGLILINPWVRTEATSAHARIQGYYGRRLLATDFWARLLRQEIDLKASIKDVWLGVKTKFGSARGKMPNEKLPERVAKSLLQYRGRVLLVLSGADLTAKEFEASLLKLKEMKAWLRDPRISLHRLGGANHTYSQASWRDQLHDRARAWLQDLP